MYQVENAAVAAMLAAELLGDAMAAGAVRSGLEQARWRGRFDLQELDGGQVLFDGGHNAAAVASLVRAFSARWSHAPVVVYGAREDKDAARIIDILKPLARRFVFTRPGREGGWRGEEMIEFAAPVPATYVDEPREAIASAMAQEGGDEVQLCCGSLYLVGYLREAFGLE